MHLGLTRPTVKISAATGSRQLGVIDSCLPPGGRVKYPHWAARHLATGGPAEMVELARNLSTVTPGQFEAVHEQPRSRFATNPPLPAAITGHCNR